MNQYQIYGHTLQSEIDFPDLNPATDSKIKWSVSVGGCVPPTLRDKQVRGAYELAPGWEVLLEESTDPDFRLTIGPAGTFDLKRGTDQEEYQITWYPGEGAPEWFIRSVILGPLMALALHDSGVLCLHGSAVAIDGHVLAFIAPKHHGKSTLSLSLVSQGALLVADDLVAVVLGPCVKVLPGVPSIKLFRDSFARLRGGIKADIISGPKTTLMAFPEELLMRAASPLAAIYVLDPDSDGKNEAARRIPLRSAEAVAEVALRTSLRDSLVGVEITSKKLQWVTEVVNKIPIYRLRLARNYDRLPEVTEYLMDWHTPRKRERAHADPLVRAAT